jgi:pimeloyl-[acyl-carrier protein] methyl ester esterase
MGRHRALPAMSDIQAQGAAALYTTALGAGPELVLVHGWGLSAAVWDDAAVALADEFRVTALDLPGHGRSASVPMTVDLAALALQLARAIPRGAAWLGWSLGGMAALQLAGQMPERVDRLVLVAVGARFSRAADWPWGVEVPVLEAFARGLEQDYRDTLRRFLALQLRGSDQARDTQRILRQRLFSHGLPEPAALDAGLRILAQGDLRPVLGGVRCPVLILCGERDPLVPVAGAQALQHLLPSSRLVTIAGAGHAPFLSHPARFIGEVRRFLHD